MSKMRVLVLSGVVALANSFGSVTGRANELLAAEQDAATEPFTPTFSADRPFLLLIRHMKTGTILFMGRVNNPAK